MEKILNKIVSLFKKDMPKDDDREYVITAFKDIKANSSFKKTVSSV